MRNYQEIYDLRSQIEQGHTKSDREKALRRLNNYLQTKPVEVDFPGIAGAYFKVGDVVKVPSKKGRTVERKFEDVGWTRGLNKYKDKIGMITLINDDDTVQLDVDGGKYSYPIEWLTLISAFPTIIDQSDIKTSYQFTEGKKYTKDSGLGGRWTMVYSGFVNGKHNFVITNPGHERLIKLDDNGSLDDVKEVAI